MNEDIRKIQDTVRKLEERVVKLEQAHKSQQATMEATEVHKAMEASEASIRKLERD